MRKRHLREAARRALAHEGVSRAEVNIVLTSDAEIRSLNRDYRGRDEATDVLSFAQRDTAGDQPPLPAGSERREMLGDVVISVDTAARQARDHGLALEDEVALLAVHGILHLLGYDDADEAGAEEMRTRQETILAGMRVP
ncbi:MAG: rRNA maturation RNase YbeY [Chthonomonadales bacterium]